MSGIYINGMEMPKAGNWKTIRIYYDGTCAVPNWQGDCTLMKGCEAIPVPDQTWGYDIHSAPTIIPADKDDKE